MSMLLATIHGRLRHQVSNNPWRGEPEINFLDYEFFSVFLSTF